MRRTVWVLGGLCLVVAAGLYFYRLGALSLTTDEIYHAISARSILQTGAPVLPNGTLYLKALPFSYLGAGLAALLGSVELGVRGLSGLCALLTCVVLFQLVRRLVHERAALLACVLFAFHPWTIELARWGRLYVMAGLLLALAALCWMRFETSRSRRELVIASVSLVAAVAIFPFAIWGCVALGACWVVRRLQEQPERAAVTFAWVAALLGSFAVFVFLLDRYAEQLIAATGFYSKFSFDEFTGYSPVFATFYFSDLIVFSASVVVLALQASFARRSLGQVRLLPVVGLLVLTLGGVLFITYVHLQDGATRYLFPIFPVTVAAAVVPWSSAIDRFAPQRASVLYAGLAVIALAGYGAYGTFGIPFKHHGDAYLNPSFGPTSNRTYYASFAGPARYIREHAANGDVLITGQPQFFAFYAEREADYAFKPGYGWKKGVPFYYMKNTQVLNKLDALKKVLSKAKARGQRVWIGVNDEKAVAVLDKATKQLGLTRVWRDQEDQLAVVYATAEP